MEDDSIYFVNPTTLREIWLPTCHCFPPTWTSRFESTHDGNKVTMLFHPRVCTCCDADWEYKIVSIERFTGRVGVIKGVSQ